MTNKIKRGLRILLTVLGVLVLAAVIFGVVNALVGNGEWLVGWNDYRYDETGYTVGDGTVRSTEITSIELDWIDGEVELVSCQDAFPSMTESAPAELPDSARVRWMVDAEGTLHIKYRKSSWFFGLGSQNRDKKLILRIPEAMMETLKEIRLEVVSSMVSVTGIKAEELAVETVSGSVHVKSCTLSSFSAETVSGRVTLEETVCNTLQGESVSGAFLFSMLTCPSRVELESTSADVTLRIPEASGFTLDWETVSGDFTRDFTLTQEGERFTHGDASAIFSIETVSGDLVLGIT